jgi:integrase
MPAVKPIPWIRFSTEVLRLYQPPARRPSTRAKIEQALRELAPYCQSTDQLDPGTISDWLASRPDRATPTHRSMLSSLRAACSYGDYQGWMNNPFRFRKLKDWLPQDEVDEQEEFRRHRSIAEVARLLRQADQEAQDGVWTSLRLRAVVYTLAYTGAGNREVMGLRVTDVDLDHGVIRFRSHPRRRLKRASRAAILGIPAPLAEVLAQWLPHTKCEWLFPHKYFTGPWLAGSTGSKPLDQVKALGARAGVEGLTILALRHTIGTHAESWGLSELELQSQLRHSRRATQKHYRHADLDLRRQTAAKIRYSED